MHHQTLLAVARLDDSIIAVIGMTGAFTVALVWILSATVASIFKSKHREETRREIAAYVAEGSISPQDAAALLSAAPDELRKQIASGVAWGTISAKGAERLLKAADREKAAAS